MLSFLVSASTSSYGEEVYKLGGIFAVTGPAAWLGDPEKKTMELLVKQVNAKGGILGKKVEVVVYNTQGDPQVAVLKARELVAKDKVMAIMGPSRTPTSAAVMKPFNLIERKIVSISLVMGQP